jgi:CheY-like chemotaxis protein
LLVHHGDLKLISADNGREGIVLASTRQPDVVLLDINLPDMSGLDALKYLRDHSETARIPLIALSADALPDQIEQEFEAGFFRNLTKPFNIPKFTRVLNDCLDFVAAREHSAQAGFE